MNTDSQLEHKSFWLWVMCLTGVDYFSTLGYQPSIAFDATGRLAPLATVVLVAVTLGCALPVYCHVASESPHGQGSIAMLERLLQGWMGKLLVLGLLGFAATGFVITKTLSAADAAEHLIHNPLWQHVPAWLQGQMVVTMLLLVVLGAVCLRGFREVIAALTPITSSASGSSGWLRELRNACLSWRWYITHLNRFWKRSPVEGRGSFNKSS